MSALLRLAIRATSWPTLLANRLMCVVGLWRRWSWVDEHVAVGALPGRRDVDSLCAAGVAAVVNLCEEFDGCQRLFEQRGAAYLRLPTLDYHSPSVESLHRGVTFILEQRRSGRKVYLHCKAGRRRSAILALCYLIAAQDLAPEEAERRLRLARPHVDRRLDRLETVRAFARARITNCE